MSVRHGFALRPTSLRALVACAGLAIATALQGCAATSHPEQPARLGRAVSLSAMELVLQQPAPANAPMLQTFVSADWVADLSVLLNLGDPEAKAAGLKDREEPIQVYIHALRHPAQGLFLVDTGFSAQMAKDPGSLGVGPVLRHALKLDQIKFHLGPDAVQKQMNAPLRGVFLTHAHPDHVGGLSEVPQETPIYVGPGETHERHWTHFFTRDLANQSLQGRPPLQTWRFDTAATQDASSNLAVIDVFNDGTVFALNVPGHTLGSTAYVVRTAAGPVLVVGDTSHTRWGWDHGVEPGGSSVDGARNRMSLLQLKALAARHPQMAVRLGHQR